MTIPRYSGKTTLAQLKEVERTELSTATRLPEEKALIMRESREGLRLDYLWKPNPGARRLFVFFSGDALRSKNDPPVFQRWTWSSFFPGHCLYVSDPSLHLDSQLGLAWYSGTKDVDPMPAIIDRVSWVAGQMNLHHEEVYAYGSSGGGFAALRMAALMPGAGVVAINPQTSILDYHGKAVEKYLRVCFGETDREAAFSRYPDRLSVLEHCERLRGRKLIYIQNTLDTHHLEMHFKPFCRLMGVPPLQNESEGNFRRLLFSDEGGHGKAESQQVFDRAMQIIQKEFS